MKITDQNTPVRTIPQGVWESSRPGSEKEKEKNNSATKTTDLQGNGYPEGKTDNRK